MSTHELFLKTTKRSGKEFGLGNHIAGLIVLVVVATLGSLQLIHPGSNTAALDSAQQANNAPAAVEYFPAQYVNQATQPEKQIETF
jgi:hypothetical protein